jgi:tetratricopeptide (TPR) repeat protein
MPQQEDTKTTKPYPNNIRPCIKNRGYTIQEVANEIRISRRTLTNYIAGTVPIPRGYLEKIAHTIGCEIQELTAQSTFSKEAQPTPTAVKATPSNKNPLVSTLTDEERELLAFLQTLDSNLLTDGPEDNDTSQRTLLRQILNIAIPAFAFAHARQPYTEPNSNAINDDLITFFERTVASNWELYYTGGAVRVAPGLDTLVKEITKLVKAAQGTSWHGRTLTLLTLSYQLQSCVLRDMMNYTQANMAYQRAFHVAQELDDPELMSAAIVRQGVTLIQQDRPKEAIIYLSGALDITDTHSFPFQKGHTLQALAEAYAKTQQGEECWNSIGQAETFLEYQNHIQERSFIRGVTTASIAAQKGVNAVLLRDYRQAIILIDKSLTTYDPALIRGRARLIAQKAEACYGLGIIDDCITNASTALTLAQSAGSNRTIARVRALHTALIQSSWGKEQSIVQLGEMLNMK